jgi:hypothetical protein
MRGWERDSYTQKAWGAHVFECVCVCVCVSVVCVRESVCTCVCEIKIKRDVESVYVCDRVCVGVFVYELLCVYVSGHVRVCVCVCEWCVCVYIYVCV